LFSSFLAYQLIDVLLALIVVGIVARAVARSRLRAWARRHPTLLGTAMRRCLLLELPLHVAGFGVVLVVFHAFVQPRLQEWMHGEPSSPNAASALSFLGFAVAFWIGAAVVPLRAMWLALRPPRDDVATPRTRATDRVVAALVVAGAAALLADTTIVEPRKLVVERTRLELPGWPAGSAPLRIALISDVQAARLTDHERRLVEIVDGLHPDLVLDAGDLVSQSLDESLPLAQARFVLDGLHAPLGVYVVNGDVDDSVAGGIRRIVAGTAAQLLENRSVVLPPQPPVELAGFDPRDADGYARALAAPPRAALRLALVHRPRHYAELGRAGFAAVFAGHTHGGQVVLPGFGPPMTLEVVPRAVAAGGLHRMEDGTLLYVTRGVGVEGGFAPPIRFDCPPEVSLIEVGPPRP